MLIVGLLEFGYTPVLRTCAKAWWVWRSWLARQIVALEVEGSNPFTHPIFPHERGDFVYNPFSLQWTVSSAGRAGDS